MFGAPTRSGFPAGDACRVIKIILLWKKRDMNRRIPAALQAAVNRVPLWSHNRTIDVCRGYLRGKNIIMAENIQ